MKKSLLILSLVSLFLTGCPPLPQYQIDEIEYKAITRGSSERILLKKETPGQFKTHLIHEKNNQEVFKTKFKKKDFKKLYKILKKIDLKTINQLEIPSKKHQYDGAMITTLEIGFGKEIYKSVSFDDDNPPKELKELIDYLQGLVQ